MPEPSVVLNQSVSSTHNYKSKPIGLGRARERTWTISWIITGTLTGTLVFEVSNSSEATIAKDAGDAQDQTDKATWQRYQPIYDSTDTLVASGSIAITNTTSDGMVIEGSGWNAMRATYTNATGSGTVVVTVTARAVN